MYLENNNDFLSILNNQNNKNNLINIGDVNI